MFTGIIQALGTIQKLDNRGNDIRLTVASPTLDMADLLTVLAGTLYLDTSTVLAK
jgi:riboflavin synthase alpha subunit